MNGYVRAAAYRDMVELLNKRHVKRTLQDYKGGVCLVGAAHKVVGKEASMVLQEEIAREILARNPILRDSLVRLHRTTPEGLTKIRSRDGGLLVVEDWNDLPFRRTKKIVALLTDLAERCEAAAKDELIAELTAMVEDLKVQKAALQEQIRTLKEENARLSEEVTFWRRSFQARRAAKASESLAAASESLADLDAELNKALEQLTSA